MSRNLSFYLTPVGAKVKTIEDALLANAKTSLDLVPDHAVDGVVPTKRGKYVNQD